MLAAAPVTLDDIIRNAASLVSLALALLTLFTNRRLAEFDEEQKAGLGPWKKAAWGPLLMDSALFGATLLVLITISPLVVDAWPPNPGRSDAVIPNLLLIATAGLAVVAGIQLSLAIRRVRGHTKASDALES